MGMTQMEGHKGETGIDRPIRKVNGVELRPLLAMPPMVVVIAIICTSSRPKREKFTAIKRKLRRLIGPGIKSVFDLV